MTCAQCGHADHEGGCMDNCPDCPVIGVYTMYYTFCSDPACGALNDYGDTPAEGRANAARHRAWHERERERRRNEEAARAVVPLP